MRANVAERPQIAYSTRCFPVSFRLDFCPREREHGLKISRFGEEEDRCILKPRWQGSKS